MNITIHYPDIEMRVGDRILKLESYTCETDAFQLKTQITRPINSFVKKLTEMLYRINVEVEVDEQTTIVSTETSSGGSKRQWHYSPVTKLPTIPYKDIKFGSRLHAQFARSAYGNLYDGGTSAKLLIQVGLSKRGTDPRKPYTVLTEEGTAEISKLRTRQLTKSQELTLAATLLSNMESGEPSLAFTIWKYDGRIDYLAYNNYITQLPDERYKLTDKGISFIRERSVVLSRRKLKQAALIRLIYFLPLEMLPKYIAHESGLVREAAKSRMDELQKGGSSNEMPDV